MRIDIVTVFPEMVAAALDHSIVKRAMEREIVDIRVVNLRDFTSDRHRSTDDVPYGGGGGMVMKIEPIARALAALDVAEGAGRIVLTDPRGTLFTQAKARAWAQEARIVILCGHYEGVDERVREHLVTDEVSIGDYVLTGGELPALVIVDAVTRLQAGALGDAQAAERDSFAEGLLEHPHYTRPVVFNGWGTPDVLTGGHHKQIEIWRRWHQLRLTRTRRPDLFDKLEITEEDKKLMQSSEPGPRPLAKSVPRQSTSDTEARAASAEEE